MSESARPEPSRTIAILFGASRWEKHDALDSPNYAASYSAAAERVRDFLFSEKDFKEKGLSLARSNVLDLFDRLESNNDQDSLLREFLRQRVTEKTATVLDVLIYFVGHGSANSEGKFIFILRSTEKHRVDQTAYRAKDLAAALFKEAPTQRRWLLLDCCASAKAFVDFQPSRTVHDILQSETEALFPARGTALFAASSSDAVAHANLALGSTAFTAALMSVLAKGDPRLGESLTLSEVALLTQKEINDLTGPTASRPELSDPDQRKGEISVVPFFPNAARRAQSVNVRFAQLAESVDALTRAVAETQEAINAEARRRSDMHDALRAEMAQLSGKMDALGANDPSRSEAPPFEATRHVSDHHTFPGLTLAERDFLDRVAAGRRNGSLLRAVAILTAAAQAFLIAGVLIPGMFLNALFPLRLLGIGSLFSGLATLALIFASMASSSRVASAGPSDDLSNLLIRSRFYRRAVSAIHRQTPFGTLESSLTLQSLVVFALAFGVGASVVAAAPGLGVVPGVGSVAELLHTLYSRDPMEGGLAPGPPR